MARFLVIRLSALGDVAISVPLISALAEQYPEHDFTVLSQPKMAGLFDACPSNVYFYEADIYGKHKGFFGLYRLFREIGAKNVDIICDIHDVIRTRIICFFFSLHGIPLFRIHKERENRRRLTRRKKKKLVRLTTSFQHYRNVFDKAGFLLNDFNTRPKMEPSRMLLPEMEKIVGIKQTYWLGFAPFARHKAKMYPLVKFEEVLACFAADDRFTVYLFGGGKDEMVQMQKWKTTYPAVKLPCCNGISEEIRLISCLDLMVTMDSANMHLGSLAHTPVISIWGATHPYAGFYGLFQPEENAVQLPLSCRPCSIFGNKPCYRNDYACLNEIRPKQLIEAIYQACGLSTGIPDF